MIEARSKFGAFSLISYSFIGASISPVVINFVFAPTTGPVQNDSAYSMSTSMLAELHQQNRHQSSLAHFYDEQASILKERQTIVEEQRNTVLRQLTRWYQTELQIAAAAQQVYERDAGMLVSRAQELARDAHNQRMRETRLRAAATEEESKRKIRVTKRRLEELTLELEEARMESKVRRARRKADKLVEKQAAFNELTLRANALQEEANSAAAVAADLEILAEELRYKATVMTGRALESYQSRLREVDRQYAERFDREILPLDLQIGRLIDKRRLLAEERISRLGEPRPAMRLNEMRTAVPDQVSNEAVHRL